MRDYAPWQSEHASEVIAEHRHRDGAMLPILHALQDVFGYVPEAAVPMVAEALNLSRAEVHGVVTFYHDFRREPRRPHVLKLCRPKPARRRAAMRWPHGREAKLGIGLGETTPDGASRSKPSIASAFAPCAPSAMLDGRVVGRLDERRLDALLAEAQR